MNAIARFRKCTLTDEELLEKVDKMVDSLYKETKNRNYHITNVLSRHIPARPNDDFDLLIGELIIRYHEKINNEKDTGTADSH